MPETPVRRGPLAGLSPLQHPGVTVTPLAEVPLLNLRGRAGESGFRDAVAEVLGAAPPTEPNTTARGRGVTLFWLGPDEWLAAGEPGAALPGEALVERLEGVHAAVTEVGDGHAWLALTGPQARGLLARGCPLDLHPEALPAGRCAQTRLAQASVLLHAVAVDQLHVGVRRSMAGYLWRWLATSLDRLEVAVARADSAAEPQARSAP